MVLRVIPRSSFASSRRQSVPCSLFLTIEGNWIHDFLGNQSQGILRYRFSAMFLINMRLFKSTMLLLSLLVTFLSKEARCLPLEESTSLSPSSLSTTVTSDEHYDQRQNGTDNYRIHVDGLVVVVAPVEALLLAGGAPSGTNQSDVSFLEPSLPSTSKPEEDNKPSLDNLEKPTPSLKSTHRSSMRFLNLLAPFLRRLHHKE